LPYVRQTPAKLQLICLHLPWRIIINVILNAITRVRLWISYAGPYNSCLKWRTRTALLRLRLEGQTRRLWIDAIRINQKDLDERAQQVRLLPLPGPEALGVVGLVVASDNVSTRKTAALLR
jgi:hypothetical protein